MLTRGFLSAVCLCLGLSYVAPAQQYTITTFAGTGKAGFADGSDLTAAQFTSPNAIAFDSKGSLYVADTGNHRIRLISGNTVSTVAGNGTQGYNGSGQAATSANINSPGGVVVDSSGNFYISETSNHVVRKISGGTITLFAGSGTAGNDGDGGAANVAHLYNPTGLALDSDGNLYIADSGNNLIRRVTKDGKIANWVGAANTGGSLKNPTGICFDAAGALYIADTGNHRIAKYANGKLTTVAGLGVSGFGGDSGPAVKATLNNPVSVAVDADGTLYIADMVNGRIRKVTPNGIIYTIAGRGGAGYNGDNGLATAAQLYFPRGVAVGSNGKIYIADTINNVIRTLTPTGTTATVAGVGNSASFLPVISPGALATVFGSNFGTATAEGAFDSKTKALPTALNGIGVTVNGTPAPLLYVSPGQINFQVPWTTPTGTANVAVTINGAPGSAFPVPVHSAAPGLFVMENGAAIAQNADYTLNDASHPVAPGGMIIAYLSGSGSIDPGVADGVATPLSPLTFLTSSKSVKIGNADAQIYFAGLCPTLAGLVQFNIAVPAGLPAGTYPLTVTIDGQTSNAGNIVVK